MKNIFIVIVAIFFFKTMIIAQVSLWSEDYNIYEERLFENTLIQIKVEEDFVITINNTWEDDKNIKYIFTPDSKYLNFLQSSEQSKSNTQKNKIKYQIKDKLKFNVAGILGTPNQGTTLFPVQAQKIINIDNKQFTMILTGLIDPAYVEDNIISSHYIGNLNLSITSKPEVDADNSLTLNVPEISTEEEIGGNQQITTSSSQISDVDKQRYLQQYLRQMIQILNQ